MDFIGFRAKFRDYGDLGRGLGLWVLMGYRVMGYNYGLVLWAI